MNGIKEFLSGARDLARNPLGIIALFISFIYGLATVLVGAYGDKLAADERRPIVWFVVIFPFVVLWTFYLLVTKHHGKLYAPADYKEDKSFLDTLRPQTPEMIASRVNDEVESVAQADISIPVPAADIVTAGAVPSVARTDLSISAHDQVTATDAASATVEGSQRLNEIRSEVVIAERLAIAKVEQELGKTLRRQVSFAYHPDLSFDAASLGEDEIVLIEVKLLRNPVLLLSAFREFAYRGMLVKEKVSIAKSAPLRLIVVLVYSFVDQQQLVALVRRTERMAADTLVPVEFKYYSLTILKQEFPALARG